MTGIAGYVTSTKRSMPAILDRMSESMRYTQSAVVEKWANDLVGVCRVHHGIINANPQPVFNEDKSIFLLMDGEVFDYENKSDATLGRPALTSEKNDADYCLRLYEKLGDQAFKQLNGSFSFAIYESSTKEVLLVTDRFSSHPIFYSLTSGGTLFFGSKLSSVLQAPEIRRELDFASIFELFTFRRIFGTKTLYKDIALVPSATVMRYREGRLTFNRYWKLLFKNVRRPDEYYVGKLAGAMSKSVERRTREKSIRYGIMLSGGLDSRTVFAASNREMVAFTTTCSHRDARLAKMIAQTKGCKQVLLRPSPEHYVNILDKAVDISDGSSGFYHAHLIDHFDEILHRCDVLFHGQFLDVFKGLFLVNTLLKIGRLKMGIPISVDLFLANLSDEDLVERILDDSHRNLNPMQVFRPNYARQIARHVRSSLKIMVSEARRSGALPSQVWEYIFWSMLPRSSFFLDLTHIRAFMLERSVILDNDLFEICLEMPPNMKRGGRVYRKALMRLDPRIAKIPNANDGLSTQTPTLLRYVMGGLRILHVVGRVAEDSWPSFSESLRQSEKLRMVMEETIRDPQSLDPAIFDRERILEMLKEHVDRKADYGMLFIYLLTFGRWHKKFGPSTKADIA